MSRVVIAGGRDYRIDARGYAWLDGLHVLLAFDEVVSGACSGVDTDGEQWATSKGLRVTRFPANWARHGRAAGPLRNDQMAVYAARGHCALFPGGAGTASMRRCAEKHGLTIHTYAGVPHGLPPHQSR